MSTNFVEELFRRPTSVNRFRGKIVDFGPELARVFDPFALGRASKVLESELFSSLNYVFSIIKELKEISKIRDLGELIYS